MIYSSHKVFHALLEYANLLDKTAFAKHCIFPQHSVRKLAQLAEEQLKRTTERVKALTVQLHRFIPTIYICIDTLMYCHHHLMYYVFIFNFLDDRLLF